MLAGGVVYEEGAVGGPGGTGCSVWSWGGGITLPTRLPLPSSDTIVTQVAAGRTQKAAVTKNGRIFVWEVSISHRFKQRIRCHAQRYSILCLQVTKSDTRPHVK